MYNKKLVAVPSYSRMGKAKYAWITATPGILMIFVIITATYRNIMYNYIPKKEHDLIIFSVIVLILMLLVFYRAFKRWVELLKIKIPVTDKYGEKVLVDVEE